jgi:serine protease 16
MLFLFFIYFLAEIRGLVHIEKNRRLLGQSFVGEHEYETFHQKLDHFDSSSNVTFSQRYVINKDVYNNSHVMIVYIGGEGGLGKSSVEGGFQFYLAQTYGAVLASLEHRFYGQSQPFDRLTPDNLKYLTSYQALNDLADFITYIKG